MIKVDSKSICIDHQCNIIPAQNLAKSFACELGFSTIECGQIAIVVSELANNLIKHANGGTIYLTQISNVSNNGIQLQSKDNGPGIGNPHDALTDGYSTNNGLGLGLGAVNRIMDSLDIFALENGGTNIVCKRWLRPAERVLYPSKLEFGVASRPRQSEKENGDTFVIKCWTNHALVGVIDGLGHGHNAKIAASAARCYINDHFDQPLEQIFKGTNIACQSSRGVVMALVRFNVQTKTFQIANVGNIETKLSGSVNNSFVVRRGILGLKSPKPVVTEHPWKDDSILALYSDGIHSNWCFDDFAEEIWTKPVEAARTILLKYGKVYDDGTILIVKNSANIG